MVQLSLSLCLLFLSVIVTSMPQLCVCACLYSFGVNGAGDGIIHISKIDCAVEVDDPIYERVVRRSLFPQSDL
jgi:hypothetical protein